MEDMNDRYSDIEIDSLLTGSMEADPSLGELLDEIRTFAEWTPDPSRKQTHLMEAVSAVSTVRVESGIHTSSLSLGQTRRQKMLRKIKASRLARVAVALSVALFTSGGVAYAVTGEPLALPSLIGDALGINNDVDDGAVDDADDGAVDDVDDGAVGDVEN